MDSGRNDAPRTPMNGVRCVLFDLDGTLIDSVPAYFDLMATMFDAAGLPPAPRSLVAEFMTDGLSVLGKMIPDELAHRRKELVEQLLAIGRPLSLEMFRERIKMLPGVEQLLRHLVALEIPVGVVTTSQREFIDRKMVTLERAGLRELLDVVVTTDDAPRRKPAPDPLLEGARCVGVPARDCVYVGDSRVDIQAGRAAGMRTVAVLTGLDDAETLEREGPTLVVDGVEDLCPLFT